MSKASYWQRGETIDYKNLTDEVIEANTVIAVGSRIGVAGTEIRPGETGSLHVTGVYKMDKGDGEIAAGAEVYFDSTTGIIAAAASDATVLAGFAVETAEAGASTVTVKINA